ncbi:hypothetical protein EJB05_37490, partial [Eragrostis curvula]
MAAGRVCSSCRPVELHARAQQLLAHGPCVTLAGPLDPAVFFLDAIRSSLTPATNSENSVVRSSEEPHQVTGCGSSCEPRRRQGRGHGCSQAARRQRSGAGRVAARRPLAGRLRLRAQVP